MTPTKIWLLSVVGLYMVAMLGIGYWASRRIKNTKDYIVAGSRLGWWLSIGTIFATWFGAETCMGSSKTAYERGILGVIADPFGAGLCLIIAGLFFAKFFHKLKIETVVDFFELRYGKKVAACLSLVYLPVYFGWIGGQLLAFGIILNSITGIPTMFAVVISTMVVLTYTFLGGMWADSVADLVQMFIIIAGLLVLFPTLLFDVGGWNSVRLKIPDSFFHFYPQSPSPLAWLNYVQAWMMVGIGSLAAQDLFSRMMSPKTPNMSRWSAVSAGAMYITVGLIPVLLGIIGRVVLPEAKSDSILIDLAFKYLPLPLMALMLGALLAAIMSSADSALLAPSAIIGHNMVAYLKPNASEKTKLNWCQWSTLFVGLFSLMLALYFKNVYTLCTHAWGILLVGIAAPMIAGVYWKKANAHGAVWAAASGAGSWIVFTAALPENYPCHLFGFLVSCATLVIVSLLTQKNRSNTRSTLVKSL